MPKTSRDLLFRCMAIATDEINHHIVIDDDGGLGKCFNLYTYLQSLESKLVTVLDGPFELDPQAVARFLWCCLTAEPAGGEFRGMPILD